MIPKIAIIFIGVAFVLACGGISTSQPIILDRLVLDEQSVPTGFHLVGQEQMSNDRAAQAFPQADYEAWGRIDGIRVEFGTPTGMFFSTISEYQSEEGARNGLNHLRQEMKNAAIRGLEAAGFMETAFEDLEDPDLGDESFAWFSKSIGPTITTKNLLTSFRQDNLVGVIRWESTTNEIEADVTIDIAEQQILRGIAEKQLDLILNSR